MAKEVRKFECIRKCFHKNQLFDEGDIVTATDDEDVPKHFKLIGGESIRLPEAKKPAPGERGAPGDRDEIEAVRREYQELDIPYDGRWGLTALKGRLIEEKKRRGL